MLMEATAIVIMAIPATQGREGLKAIIRIVVETIGPLDNIPGFGIIFLIAACWNDHEKENT